MAETVDRIHDVLRALLRKAVEWGRPQENAAGDVDLPALTTTSRVVGFIGRAKT